MEILKAVLDHKLPPDILNILVWKLNMLLAHHTHYVGVNNLLDKKNDNERPKSSHVLLVNLDHKKNVPFLEKKMFHAFKLQE